MAAVRELLIRWGFEVDDKELAGLEASISDVGTAAKFVGGIVAGAAGSLFGLAEATRRTIDDLDELAQSIGVNTEFFAEFSAAAKLGGAETEDSANAIAVFTKNIVAARNGNKEAIKSFRELKISQEDLNRLPTEVLLAKLANGMRDTVDPAKRVALAQDLLGKSGRKLIPALVGGADAMAELGTEAREFGLVPGPEAIEAANKMEAAMHRATAVVTGLGLEIGTALMPVVSEIADAFADWALQNREVIRSKLTDFVGTLQLVVRTAWDTTVGLVEALRSFVGWIRETGEGAYFAKTAISLLIGAMVAGTVIQFINALRGLRAAVAAVNIAIAANPIGVLITLLSVLVALWVANWDDIKEVTLFAWEAIKEAARDALEFLRGVWSSIASTASEAWAGMRLVFTDTVTAFKQAWEGVATWFVHTVIDPILSAWDRAKGVVDRVASFLGITGGKNAGRSPGRPGSPESALVPRVSPSSFARGGAGGKTVNVDASIVVQAPAGMSSLEKDDLESRVRRAASAVFDQKAREVLAEMG